MKKYKYFTLALLSVLGLASCDESDYEYTAPEAVQGSQIYFPVSNPAKVELDELSGSFSLQITRIDSTEAINVPLTVKSTATNYTVPESVAFAENQKTADITIDYTNLVYDVMDTITITINSNSVSPYGNSEYKVVVGAPAPWTPWCKTKAEWVKAGMDADAWPLSDMDTTCTYTYTKIFGGDETKLPISYRQSTIDPEQAQIMIENWLKLEENPLGVSLVLDYTPSTGKISIEPQKTGFTDDGVGDFYITDVTHWQGKEIPGYISTYDKEKGLITLMTAWMAGENHGSCYGYGEEYVQLDGFYIPDYSVNAVFEGTLTDASQNTYALLNVASLGVDVQSVKALVVTKDDDAAAVADAIAAGEVEAVDLVLGNNKLELGNMTGELQIVAVSMAEGEVKVVESYGFEYYGSGNASPWRSLGVGLFTDDIVLPFFTEDNSCDSYNVEIQENNEKPGLYRLVDPYGPGVHPYYKALVGVDVSMPASGKYLLVNACDPEGVYVEHQSLGINWGKGEVGFVSEGARYIGNYPMETIKQAGLFGKLENGVITFPSFDVLDDNDQPTGLSYQGAVTLDGKLTYYCGTNKSISLTLPEAVTPSAIKRAQKSRNHASFRNMSKRSMFEIGTAKRVNRILVPREMK